MEEKYKTKISKLLSFGLRHDPAAINIKLDEAGWASVSDVVKSVRSRGYTFNHADLEIIVSENDKQRFALSEDKTKIRANQGHSIEIDLALGPCIPPDRLYHGTSSRYLDDIYKAKGLSKMSRQHVHLSADVATAEKVGKRHGGNLIIFEIDTQSMHKDGIVFYKSDNGVWLTDFVDTKYLQIKMLDQN